MKPFFLLIFSVLAVSHARELSGIVHKKPWAFLGRFVFNYNPKGTIVGNVSGVIKTQDPNVTILLYDDQKAEWPAIYDKGMSCLDKIAHANPDHGQINVTTGTFSFKKSIIEKLRPREWYVVLSSQNCGLVSASYSLKFVNEDHSELSVDEYGLQAIYLGAFLFWGALLGAHLFVHIQKEVYPYVVRWFSVAIGCHVVGCFCNWVHWSLYASNGRGSMIFEGTGRVAHVVSVLAFWAVISLLALGYGITTFSISEKYVAPGIASLLLFLLSYILMVLWYLFGRDPASTVYIYDSVPGVLIVLSQLLFSFWWVRRIMFSRKTESNSEKRDFYRRVMILGIAWSVILPFSVILAAVLDPWYRKRTICLLLTALPGLVFTAFAILLSPQVSGDVYNVTESLGRGDQYATLKEESKATQLLPGNDV